MQLQEQPPQQQQQQQGPQWQVQQGPPQQQGSRQQASINSLAASSATPSPVAHAPSVAFGERSHSAAFLPKGGIQLPPIFALSCRPMARQRARSRAASTRPSIDKLAASSAVLPTVAQALSLIFGKHASVCLLGWEGRLLACLLLPHNLASGQAELCGTATLGTC